MLTIEVEGSAGAGFLPRAGHRNCIVKRLTPGITKGIAMERTTMSVQKLSAQMGISFPKDYEFVKELGFPTIRIGARILIPMEVYKE